MDVDELIERYLHPEIEWHTPAQAPEPGPHLGHAGVRRAFAGYEESFDLFRPEAEEILTTPAPDLFLVLVTTYVRGKGSGVETSVRAAHLVELRGEKIVRIEVFTDREEARRRAGLAT